MNKKTHCFPSVLTQYPARNVLLDIGKKLINEK